MENSYFFARCQSSSPSRTTARDGGSGFGFFDRAYHHRTEAGRETVAITGMANLAVKVADLDAACDFYEKAGADVRDRGRWRGSERADVHLGPVMITLFTRAIYEDCLELADEGFLHPALFTDDLDRELDGHEVIFGPEVVEGAFGKRRIAFVKAPGGIRLEFMEQVEPPQESVMDPGAPSTLSEGRS
jgi:catechol 2,3-dioxygenase-like lactoylglutathione lyase family enzyme